jgi:hypothetical protein
MEAAKVWRLIERVPDRVARAQSGAEFAAGAASCVHPERLALLAEFLHWLSPLYPTTREDQTRLGLFAHKPAHVEAEEDETIALEEEALV